MKTNILTLMLWGLLSLHMQAADGDTFTANTSEGVEMTFRVISETEKTVSVSTISKSVSGTVSIPSEVVYNNETYLVTVISGWAFFDCDNVTAVNIPTTVTSIEESAFQSCTSLGSVAIPNSVTSIGKAAFQSCGSLQSVVMSENVEYFGSGVFANCTSLESINIPNDAVANNGTFAGCTGLKSITFSNKVTKISAFYGCTGLETIDIPSNIKTIGEEAFAKCTNLASVTLHDGLETIEDGAFNDCDALTSITIPNSVTSIGSKELSSTASGTFGGCDNLKTVTLSNNLTCIPSYVFSGCKKLESINIPTNLKEIRYMAFDGCTNLSGDIVLPQGVTYIGGGAFASTQITSIKIPSTMTYFAANALHGNSAVKKIIVPNLKQWCEQMDFNSNALGAEYHTIGLLHYADLYIEGNENTPIKDVVIPEGVKRINNKAFYDATITSVEIPSSVDSVYRGAFEYCEQLKTVKFNEGLKYIGNDAFAHCTSLESLKLPDGLIELGYAFYQCTGLKSVEIPNSVTTANSYVSGVFSGCTSLESVKIGNGLTIIPEIMFDGCTNLQSVEFSEGLTSIGLGAFRGCTNLQSVVFPNSLTHISSDAFYNCTSLNRIIFPNNITSVDGGYTTSGGTHYPAFDGCDNLTQVIVPDFNIADWCGKDLAGGPLKYSHHIYDVNENDLLVDVVVPEGVTTIGKSVFEGCESMISLTLPSTLTSIKDCGFKDCSNLESVTCKMQEPALNINSSNYFAGISDECVLYVPAGTKDAYTAKGWTEDIFKGGVVEASEATILMATTPEGVEMTFKVISEAEKTCMVGEELGESQPTISRDYSGSITIPSTVNGYTVTRIGSWAFSGCGDLTSVSIPESVTSLGYQSFNFTGLTSITIPNSVTSIESFAFQCCSGITSITIPSNLTNIAEAAFELVNITSIVVESGNPVYDSRENCNAIIETSTNRLIAGCQNTIIPNTVTCIGTHAFCACSTLTNVVIPNSVTTIESRAFFSCKNLTSVTFPESLRTIEGEAFGNCEGLTSITIPSGVTHIDGGAFAGCNGLTSIVVENGNTVYDSRENCNAIIETSTNTLIGGCQNTIIPNTVTCIGRAAFNSHRIMESMEIPSSVTTIESWAFHDCGLTAVIIPESVTTIEEGAFEACDGLTSVISKIEEPFTLNSAAFEGIASTCTLTVPDGTRDAYIAAGWTEEVFKGGIVIEGTDMTESLVNPDFATNDWTGWTKEAALGGNVVVAEECAEAWNNASFDIYQEVENLPDGLYEISVQGFYRYGRGNNAWNYYQAQEAPEVKEGGAPVFIYLNNMTTSFKNVFEEPADYGFYTTQTYTSPNGQYFPDGMISAATAFGEGMFTQRAYGLVQNGETMRIGVKGSSNQLNDSWVIFDNFKLIYHAQNPEVVDIVLQIKSEELGDFIDNNSESMTTSVLGSVTTTYIQSTNSNLNDDEKYDVLIATNNALVVAKENVQIVMAYQTALEAYQSACTSLEQYDPNQEEDIWTDISSMNDEIDSSNELDNEGLSDLISRMESLTYLVLEKVAYLQNPPIEIGGIYYNLDSYTQMATVVSGNTEYEGDIVIPESVEYDDVVYAVTAIGQEAFYDCDNLTSVLIPNSVTSIGGYAFANCISLTSIDIPNSVTFIDAGAFGCTHLSSVTIPYGVTSIGHNTFSTCYLLTTVTIPGSVTYIDDYAFSLCSNLTDVYCYAECVPETGSDIFASDEFYIVDLGNATLHVPAASIDDYQTTAPWSEFGNIVALNDEPIIADDNCIDGIYYELNTDAQTATVISGENKYTGDVVIPESVEYDDVVYAVTAIGSSAFESCSDLTSLTIPNSVTTIGGWAFWGCWGLTDIIIPASVVSIGESAFRYCDLTSIQVENGNPIYDSRENCNAVIETASNTLIVGCGNTVIPNGISAIGEAAFSGSHSLTSVTIPESVTSIGWTAFEETGLTDIIIPNSVTSIGAYAFSSTSLSSVFIPNSVTSIGKGAFAIYSITSVQLEDDNPVYDSRENCNAIIETASNTLIEGWKFSTIPNSVTSIGNGAFTGCSEMTSINIPNSVTSIGSEAFWGCGLTSVTIPNSVTYIGSYAFYCSSLTDMYCYASNLPQTNDEIFMDVDFANATLHVPAASIDAYQTTAPWSEFGSIVALDDEPADPDLALVNTLTIANVEVENGNSVVLPVNLNNTESITAIQFEVALPTSNDKINVVYQSDFTEYGQDALPIGYSGVSDNSERQSTAAEPYSGGGAPRLMGSNDHVNHGIYWGARSGSVGQLQFGKYAAISATGETLGDGITEDEALWLEEGDYTLNFRNAAWDDHASPYTVRICMPNTEAIFEETDIVPDVQLAHNGNTPNEDDIPVSEYEFTVTTPGYYYIEFEGNSGWQCWLLTSLSVSAKSDVQNEDPAGITISNCQLTDRKGTNHTASYEQLVNGNYQITVSSLSDDVFSGTEGVVVNLTLDVDGDMSAGAYPIRLTNIELTTDAAQTIQPADASATLTVVNGAEEPVEPVEENNTLVMENLSGRTGTQFLLPVGLLNEDDITALQFNITLPDGVSIAKNSKDKYIVEKTERCEDHTLSASKPGDANVYTVLLYSNDVESITGTDGTVLNVRLEVSEDMEAGDYEVSLSNINLTTVDEVKITPADVTCTLTVTNSIPGDANGDGSIDVTDIVGIANCILGNASNSFDATAADINGDGDVDVTDIVAVANIILHSGVQNNAKMRVVHDVIDMLDPQ